MKTATQPAHWAPWPIRLLCFLSHPLLIVPLAVPVALYFGRYTPQQITELQQVPLFLQGSTDYGGSNLFAGTLALYVVFGVLGSLYLTLALDRNIVAGSLLATCARALWILRYHILLFILGGTACFDNDIRITPNDFRNLFLWIILLSSFSAMLIVALYRARVRLDLRLALAPLFIAFWLLLGSDGNTAKAGQIRQSGEDPVPTARSARHAAMLAWHRWCDRRLGDIDEQTKLAWVGWLSDAAVIGLLLCLAGDLGLILRRKKGVSLARFWSVLLASVAVLVSGLLLYRYAVFRAERRLYLEALDQLQQSVTPAVVQAIRADPALQQKEVDLIRAGALQSSVVQQLDSIFHRAYFERGLEVCLLLPLEAPYFVFLWQNTHFRYVDVRRLAGDGSAIIDYNVIHGMLERRGDFTPRFSDSLGAGLFGFLSPQQFVAGKAMKDRQGNVAALLLVGRR